MCDWSNSKVNWMSYYFKLLFLCIVYTTHSQGFQFVEFISEDVQIIHEAEGTTVTLPFEILEGYHIQLEEVENDNLIPTKISFEDILGIEIINSAFDCIHLETVMLDKKASQVLSHSFEVKVLLKLKDNTKRASLIGELYYQTCDNFKCYFPRELAIEVPLN